MVQLSLPLHPLFVHGAVVFIPLAALCAIAFVAVPKWRWFLRLPNYALNVLALVFLMAARLTGDPLAHQIEQAEPAARDLIEKHDQMAGLLTVATFPMVAFALFTSWAFASASPLPSGWGRSAGRWPGLEQILMVVTIVFALAVIVFTVLTGDAGAKATWAG